MVDLLSRLRDARRRRRRADLRAGLAWAILALAGAGLAASGAAALLDAAPASVAPLAVDVPDTDGDGVADVVENALLGTDPRAPAGPSRLPEAWLRRHGLNASDPDLARRFAPYPRPPESPPVYGAGGLPVEFRLTLGEVYAYGRPESWDEATAGAWDSGLDPTRADVAGTGVPYGWLLHHRLDPFDASALDVPASTEVRWTPREAYERGLDPRLVDGDGDGLADEEELTLGTHPRRRSTLGVSIPDGWLVAHGFDPLDPAVPHQDPDRDGLSNLAEYEASARLAPAATASGGGLDPRALSTVGGPIPDGWLVEHGLDPFDPATPDATTEIGTFETENATVTARLTVLDEYRVNRPPRWDERENGPWRGGTDPRSNDTDGDGLTDLAEIHGWKVVLNGAPKRVFSDPRRADTDGDGLSDGEERAGHARGVSFPSTDPSAPDTDFDGLTDGEEVGLVPWRGRVLPVLDPTSRDTDEDGLEDGAEAAYWDARYVRYAIERGRYEWGPDPKPSALDVFLKTSGSAFEAFDALEPGGDADGDGVPNVLDLDSDGDGLADGWEVDPALYARSPWLAEEARRATDPARNDTDLDGLLDAWEVRYGIYDPSIPGWNLDPSLWSSFRDATSDADRDLDADSVAWYAVERGPTGLSASRREFRATNLVEARAGSDPNRRSSSPDGIPDGWKIFWGTDYLGLAPEDLGLVYPGAPGPLALPADRPPPRLGENDDVLLATLDYARWDAEAIPRLAAGESIDPATAASSPKRIVGRVSYTYAAAAENATNPYLDDSDGDGAPDVWEATWSRLGSARARVNPVAPDGDLDLDDDGLANVGEWRVRANPYASDTDFGGASDAIESRLGLDPLNPADDVRALESTTDTDGDGLPDNREILARIPTVGGRFVATDPRDVDTDRDGLLDGSSLSRVLGRTLRTSDPDDRALLADLEARGLIVFRVSDGTADVVGEAVSGSDPSAFSTAGDGVPDGWAILHKQSPTTSSGLRDRYAYGRPDWWNETLDGIWRWGLAPAESATRDHDGDGLDDYNGEDVVPFAHQKNAPALGDPRAPGLAPADRLRRAQAYGDAPETRVRPLPARAATILELDPLPDPFAPDGTAPFSGRLVTALGEPVPNASIVLALGSRALTIGAAVTAADGRFEGRASLAPTLAAPEGSAGVPFFGGLDGTAVATNDPVALRAIDAAGPVRVFAYAYNVSSFPPPRQARDFATVGGVRSPGFTGSESVAQRVTLVLPAALSIEAPATATSGSRFAANVTLLDGLARPVANATVHVEPGALLLRTDDAGRARVQFDAPVEAGPFAIRANFAGRPPSLLAAAFQRDVRVVDRTLLAFAPLAAGIHPGVEVAIEGSLRAGRGRPVPDADVAVSFLATREQARTGADGNFRVVLALPPTAPVGILLAEAVYAGGENSESARAVLEVPVRGQPRWEAANVTTTLGSPALVEARLVALDGAPLGARPVALDVPGAATSANVTDPRGRVLFEIGPEATRVAGERLLRLAFSDPRDGDAETSVRLLVTTPTTLVVEIPELVRGRVANVTGRLSDAAGTGLPGEPILVTLGPLALRVVTGDDGRFSARVPFGSAPRAGPLAVSATFEGSADGVRHAARWSSTAPLADAPAVALDDDVVLLARPGLSGRVTTILGEPLGDREIRIVGPWGRLPVTTDEAGRFAIVLPLGAHASLGALPVRIEIPPEAFLAGFSSERTLKLRDEGVLRVEAPAAALPGERIFLVAELVDSLGRRAPSARYDILLAGTPVATTRVGEKFEFTVPRGLAPGPHALAVDAVSDAVRARPWNGTLDVRRPTAVALEEADPVVVGRPGEVRVRLSVEGQPLANATVLVYGVGPAPLGVVTDAAGEAAVPVPAGGADVNALTVVYAGGAGLAPASLAVEFASVAAPAPPVPAPVGFVAGALLVGAAAVAVLRRVLARRGRGAAARALGRAARKLAVEGADARALYDAYLELLALLGLDEEAAERLTFGDLLARVVGETPSTEADRRLLANLLNEAVYAPELLAPASAEAASGALARLARAAEAKP